MFSISRAFGGEAEKWLSNMQGEETRKCLEFSEIPFDLT